jgi:phosphoglycolate phosphatase
MNLLFDLDGTLANPLYAFADSINYAFKSFAWEPPTLATLRKMIGPPLQVSLPQILGPDRASFSDEILRLYRQHHADTGIYSYEFYQGMEETLTLLQKQHQIFLATSKPLAAARSVLEHFKKTHFFVKMYGSEWDGTYGLKPDLIRMILKTSHLQPEQTLMIGDRSYDIDGARQNHLRSIGVTWGFGGRGELEAAGATWVCDTWAELITVVQQASTATEKGVQP